MIKSAVKSESAEKKLLWDLFDSRVCFLHTALLQPISKFPASKSYLTFIRQEKSRQKKKWGNMTQVSWMFKRSCGQNMFQDKQFKVGDILWHPFDICNERSQSLRKNINLFIMYTNRERINIKKRNRKKSFQILNNNKNSPVSASFCLFVARSNIHKSTYNSCSKPVTHTSRLCPAHSL